MRVLTGAALVLLGASSLDAQTVPDFSTAAPIDGNWSYAVTADGSEAIFVNRSAAPQLWIHCTRATRRVSIAAAAGAAASSVKIWTSALSRELPATFNPTTARLTVDLAPFDPLLDAIATSRGRISVTAGAQPPLIVPTWAEVPHVIEDCRA